MTEKTERATLSNERRRMGETHPRAVLTDEQVEEMRDRWENDSPRPTHAVLAREYGVSTSTVASVVTFRRRIARPMNGS